MMNPMMIRFFEGQQNIFYSLQNTTKEEPPSERMFKRERELLIFLRERVQFHAKRKNPDDIAPDDQET